MIDIFIGFLLAVHIVVCLLLTFIVLMQRPRSEGLGTAFGSAVTDTLFGSSTGNVLTKMTTWLGTIFFITTVSLAYLYTHHKPSSKLGSELQEASTVKKTPTAPTTNIPSPTPTSPVIPKTDKTGK